MKPLVLIDGNCQGQAIAAILQACDLADAYFVGGDLGFVPGFRKQSCRYLNEDQVEGAIRDARNEGRPVVQGTQATPMSDGQTRGYSADVDQVVRYPHLQFFAQTVHEFEHRFGRRQSPKRMFDIDVSTVTVCQRRAGSRSDFAQAMKTLGVSEPLFHTALHPSGLLTSMLFADFAVQLTNCDPARIEMLRSIIAKGEGINFVTDHPVSTEYQREMGISWGGTYPFYYETLTRAKASDWEWISVRSRQLQDMFGDESQVWQAIAKAEIALGRHDNAKMAIDKLLALSPGFMHFWLMAFSYYRSLNDEATVVGLVDRAKAFFGEQRQIFHLLAFVMIERQMYPEAETFAQMYHQRTPDRYDALVPILTIFLLTGRADEARNWALNAAQSCAADRVEELRSNLSVIHGLDLSWFDQAIKRGD